MKVAEVSKEDRLAAALAHGLVLASSMGALGAMVVWLLQKEKSKWAAFQALQAAVYQFFVLLVTMAGWALWMGFFFASFIPLMSSPAMAKGAAPPPLFFISMASMVIPLAFMGLGTLYGLVGALLTLTGQDFRYFILGDLIEKYLAKGQ